MGYSFFSVFLGLSQRGFLRLWASKLGAKRMPLEVVLETFPETLKTVIFDDPSMVLAGLWGSKTEYFRSLFRHFFQDSFLDGSGNTNLCFLAPIGGPMGGRFRAKC